MRDITQKYVTRMAFQVSPHRIAPPPGPFGGLRKALALWLWPQLRGQHVVEGIMEAVPVRQGD
jgi:hypothetical protein